MTNYILIQYPKYISIFIALLTVISFFLLFERYMEKRENTYDDILREKYPKLEQLKHYVGARFIINNQNI